MLNILPTNVMTLSLNSGRLPVAQFLLNSLFIRENHQTSV